MRKKFKSLAMILLAATMAASMSGCRNDPPQGLGGQVEELDTTRTQLYISNFNGGYGNEWLYKAKARFEKEFSTTSFEEGKTGVQIYIDDNKEQGHTVLTNIENSRNEVFFTQGVNYYEFVNAGVIADITDIVTEPLTRYGETKTIEDKYYDANKEYLNVNGKYYAIPYCTGSFGIIYDRDLFDQKGFYFAADGNVNAETTKYNTAVNNGNNGFIYEKTDVKSNGPDGKPNTIDDGLPATYDEYFMLCEYISNAGCIPTIWTGMYRTDYMLNTLRAFARDFMGDELSLFYTFNGTAKRLVHSIGDDGKVTFAAAKTIDSTNGYELYKSAGLYYAAEFYQRLTSNPRYYHGKGFNQTHSHLDAQADFLFSRPEGNEPIAMMFEGSYWANESRQVFADIAAQYGDEYSAKNRNFGIMPIPKVSEKYIGEPYTVLGDGGSFGFVNANCSSEKLVLAKKFLQFVNTDVSMREYTVTTNTLKGMKYEMLPSDLEQMTGFGRLLYETQGTQNVINPYSKHPTFLNNEMELRNLNYIAKIGTTVYNNPIDVLKGTSTDKISAKNYFLGLSKYYDQNWWNGLNG